MTSSLGVARACPDLPDFARICPEAIYGFVTVEIDFEWKIKTFLGSFNGFEQFYCISRKNLVIELRTEKVSSNQIAPFLEV